VIAVFEGMLDPKNRHAVIAHGPFTVEVYPDVLGKANAMKYRARMLPTHQLFHEMHTPLKGSPRPIPLERPHESDVRIVIEHRFQKKIKDWYDRPADLKVPG
jgi:hypothetical protein